MHGYSEYKWAIYQRQFQGKETYINKNVTTGIVGVRSMKHLDMLCEKWSKLGWKYWGVMVTDKSISRSHAKKHINSYNLAYIDAYVREPECKNARKEILECQAEKPENK